MNNRIIFIKNRFLYKKNYNKKTLNKSILFDFKYIYINFNFFFNYNFNYYLI